jgi:hypothetical protein
VGLSQPAAADGTKVGDTGARGLVKGNNPDLLIPFRQKSKGLKAGESNKKYNTA